MKKLTVLLTFILVSVLSSNAQKIGIRGGGVLSGISEEAEQSVQKKAKGGFFGGVFAELPIGGDIFVLRPEVIYSQQGFRKDFSLLGKSYTSVLSMNYINVPVMLKLRIGNLGLLGGAQFGFLMGNPSLNTTYQDGSLTLDRNKFATLDFGLGVGVDFAITNSILIDLRYTHGLVNAFDNSNSSAESITVGNGNNFRHLVLALGLAFRF